MKKVVLVTGAGKERVGATVARVAAGRGWDVAVHYRTSQVEAESLIQELASLGSEARAFQADLGQEQEAHRLIGDVYSAFGQLDLVVNCASTWLRKSFEATTALDLFTEFQNNTLSTFLVSQAAGLRMCEQPSGGHILTVGDWAIERPYPDHSAYFVSKGAIPTMTRMLAVELAARNPKVRVNCIAPGPVMVPDSISEAERETTRQATLVKSLGTPESVAQMVFALTDNQFVTGVVVPVDGGRTIYANEHQSIGQNCPRS